MGVFEKKNWGSRASFGTIKEVLMSLISVEFMVSYVFKKKCHKVFCILRSLCIFAKSSNYGEEKSQQIYCIDS